MKGMWLTFAGILFLAFAGIMERDTSNLVIAATDVHVVVSTSFQSRVVVTSATSIRIDNWNDGVQGVGTTSLIVGRVAVCFDNQDSGDSVWGGHTTTGSSSAANNHGGHELKPGDYQCVGALRGHRIDAIAADAAGTAGAVISVMQYGKE